MQPQEAVFRVASRLPHARSNVSLEGETDLPRFCRKGRAMAQTRKGTLEYVEPIGARVLVRKDDPKRETRGGIALPDAAEIPTITGRIVAISAQIEHDEDVPLRQYDKILFHPKNIIPVDFEVDNQLFVVPVDDVVAVFRRDPPTHGHEDED
jgi:chaperonin GroES